MLAVAALGVSVMLPGIGFSADMRHFFERLAQALPPERIDQMKQQAERLPVHPFWLALGQGLIAGPTINAVAAFGEEVGWRGLLQHELAFLGFWKASILIGAVWGLWHAPLILQGHNYPQHPVIGVFMMTSWCTLLGPIISYVRLRARSVIAAAVMHGSVNATFGLSTMLLKGGNDLTTGLTGLPGFAVLGLVLLSLYVHDRHRSQ
jgi:membrane protease YdiL (CAAX protease family)